MFNIKYLVRETLKEQGLIQENYAVTQEINKLSQEVFSFMIKLWIKAGEVDMAYELFIKDFVNPKDYDKLKNFLTASTIIFEFTNSLPQGVRGNMGHAIEPGKTDYRIQLQLTPDEEKKINLEIETFEDGDNVGSLVYWTLDKYYTVMIHELQHAFDAFRSRNKFSQDQSKFDYRLKQYKRNKAMEKNRDDMSQQDINDIQSHQRAYLQLTHEISARFTQTVRDLRVWEFNKDRVAGGPRRKIKPFEHLVQEFKMNFQGYEMMRERVKKKLMRRLAKYYNDAVEDFQNQQKNKI